MDDVNRYCHLRGLTDPAWLLHRMAAVQVPAVSQGQMRGRMLEIGCGAKTKGLLVGDVVAERVGLDHEEALVRLIQGGTV